MPAPIRVSDNRLEVTSSNLPAIPRLWGMQDHGTQKMTQDLVYA